MRLRHTYQTFLQRICPLITLLVTCFTTKAFIHLILTALSDTNTLDSIPAGQANDASRLSATQIASTYTVPTSQAEIEVRQFLHHARAKQYPVNIAGMRHSMGSQTICPGGMVLDMLPLQGMELDTQRNILSVQAGARWADIIRFLDEHGRSVIVMQSNNSFTVGGSISVNCHGWQHNHPPIATTVESVRLVLADGTLVRCSREEHAELFSLVLGGYGLFGIILDLELRVCANNCYRMEQFVVPSEQYSEVFEKKVNQGSGVRMVYGRLNVSLQHFLCEATLTIFYVDQHQALQPLSKPGLAGIRRAVFRGSVGSEYGKELRWQAEKAFGAMTSGQIFSRNHLLNEGVEVFENRSRESTDILQEYFLPSDKIEPFLARLRIIIPAYQGDLLNVTIRNVYPDEDSFLRYADRAMFGLVMLFHQLCAPLAEARMEAMTQEIIEAALELGGRYYLPYRLHATVEQFARAYPQARAFFALKRHYDPDEVFQNAWYQKYGKL